jgi:parallel beta-helix repeat protein
MRAMSRTLRALSAISLGTAALVGLTAGTASAVPITTCGQTVTDDSVLTTDLTCATGDAIVVGADGVTVDLAGHSIAGSVTANGVSVTGHAGVTVTNGSFSGFATAVRAVNSTNVIAQGLDITVAPGDLTSGVVLGNSQDSTVVDSVVHGGGIGVLVEGGSGNTVRDNRFDAPQQGVFISAAAGTTVDGNRADGSAAAVAIGTGSTDTVVENNTFATGVSGIYVDPFANTGTVIRDNTATDYASNGIFIDAGTSVTTIERNRVERNNTGIIVRTATTTITANQAFDNAALGIDAIAGVTDGGGNQAAGNGDPRQCVGVVCTDPFAPLTPLTPLAPTSPAALLVTPRFTG